MYKLRPIIRTRKIIDRANRIYSQEKDSIDLKTQSIAKNIDWDISNQS